MTASYTRGWNQSPARPGLDGQWWASESPGVKQVRKGTRFQGRAQGRPRDPRATCEDEEVSPRERKLRPPKGRPPSAPGRDVARPWLRRQSALIPVRPPRPQATCREPGFTRPCLPRRPRTLPSCCQVSPRQVRAALKISAGGADENQLDQSQPCGAPDTETEELDVWGGAGGAAPQRP